MPDDVTAKHLHVHVRQCYCKATCRVQPWVHLAMARLLASWQGFLDKVTDRKQPPSVMSRYSIQLNSRPPEVMTTTWTCKALKAAGGMPAAGQSGRGHHPYQTARRLHQVYRVAAHCDMPCPSCKPLSTRVTCTIVRDSS